MEPTKIKYYLDVFNVDEKKIDSTYNDFTTTDKKDAQQGSTKGYRTPTFEEFKNGGKSPVDIPDLILILQAMGFCLGKFEKGEVEQTQEKPAITIELSCPISKMHAVLTKQTNECKCPTNDVAGDASFWNISGTAPGSLEGVNVSHSSMLPIISPSRTKLVADLLNSALIIIRRNNFHQNEETFNISKKKSMETLNTTKTISPISPIGTPLTSSPIPHNTDTIIENLKQIKKLVEQSLIANNGTSKPITTRRISNISNVNGNTPTTSNFMNITSKNSLGSANRKTLVDRVKFVAPKTSTLLKPSANGSLNSSRKDTPIPNKLDTKPGIALKRPPLLKIPPKAPSPAVSRIAAKIPTALPVKKK